MLTTVAIHLFLACSSGRNLLIFNIGDSRDKVINTIVREFKIEGERPTKEWYLDKEHGNHITLYDCEYRGQQYRKIRVYYSDEKVCRLELKIDKDRIQDLTDKLESAFGTPHRISFPYLLGITIDANVFMGEIEAVVLIDRADYYEISVLSGEERDKLNHIM